MDGKMILIGMFDSPFVRRVAVTLQWYEIPFEHRDWSVGRDFDRIRAFNPLGRVPTLVCPDGVALSDSGAILDYLDDGVGATRALVPRTGLPRRETLRVMALAAGAAEKGVLQVYERVFRPEEKRHESWVARLHSQMCGALEELEHLAVVRQGQWLSGPRMTQADITVSCAFGFLKDALQLDTARDYPALSALSGRCEALPSFRAVNAPFCSP